MPKLSTTLVSLTERAQILRQLEGLPPETLIGPPEIAVLTGHQVATIRHSRGRLHHQLPPRVAGMTLMRWRLGDTLAWLRGLETEPTAR